MFCFLLFPFSLIGAKEAEPTPTPDLSQVYEENPVSQNGDRGERILRVQQRLKDLGYLNYRPTGYYMSMTLDAMRQFQQKNRIDLDNVIGQETMERLFGNHPTRSTLSGMGPAPKGQPYGRSGEPTDWNNIKNIVPADGEMTIIDMDTSISFSAQRSGGTNHMDLTIPNTKERTKYLSLFGGKAGDGTRAVLVSYGGREYAASLSGMAHGENGAICLYFKGSTSNGLGVRDESHDASVEKASGH